MSRRRSTASGCTKWLYKAVTFSSYPTEKKLSLRIKELNNMKLKLTGQRRETLRLVVAISLSLSRDNFSLTVECR